MTPVEQEIGEKPSFGCLLKQGCPDVDVRLYWFFDAVEGRHFCLEDIAQRNKAVEIVWVKRNKTYMDGSTKGYSRRPGDLGRAPATDLPTYDADRDGATRASQQAKTTKRVVRTLATRMMMVSTQLMFGFGLV